MSSDLIPANVLAGNFSILMSQLHCIIHGRVQGVFFRAETEEEASRLGLTGWVRNLPDGSVECLAQGRREKLEMLLAWLSHGPPVAKVTHVESEWQPETRRFHNFCIV